MPEKTFIGCIFCCQVLYVDYSHDTAIEVLLPPEYNEET